MSCAYHTALGQAMTEEGFCLRTLQQYLYDQKFLQYQFVTGKWNPQTRQVLGQLIGAGWEGTSGGACSLVGVLQARGAASNYFNPGGQPGYPGQYPGQPGYPGQQPGGGLFSDTGGGLMSGLNIEPTALIVGIGVLALVMLLRKKD